ncbi:hypothetical protein [Stenotrophomonas sp.]|uniref:hypothetical protein n=1 Tax=Stenotrophomonas sp. TaxID=69392 RepID=UPI0028ADEAF7|nr:hypothetical protein [Stenotrophomonas sp.]
MPRNRSEERSATYYALFEPTEILENGRWNLDSPVLIDAMPVASANSYAAMAEAPDTVDFLLLSVDAREVEEYELSDGEFERGEDTWYLITLSSRNFADAIPVWTLPIGDVSGEEGRPERLYMSVEKDKKGHAANWSRNLRSSLNEAAEKLQVEAALSNVDVSLHGVAVYDVGQANFNALVDECEHPRMFFDFGRPIYIKGFSSPVLDKFNPLIFGEFSRSNEPVVLSHLDQDHWHFAFKSGVARWDKKKGAWIVNPVYRPTARERPWVVRLPPLAVPLGASHLHLLLSLKNKQLAGGASALHIWNSNWTDVRVGSVVIHRCDPGPNTPITPAYLKNNTSLALTVESDHARVLLTGDADYPSIPASAKQDLTGMVAPHHGGGVTANSTPTGIGPGRMVFSTFNGAYSGNPSPMSSSEAQSAGWIVTQTNWRSYCSRCQQQHGHKYIPLLAAPPQCGCDQVVHAQICLPTGP